MMARSQVSRKRTIGAITAIVVLLAVIFLSSPLAPYVRGAVASAFLHRGSAQNASPYSGLTRDALLQKLSDADNELALVRYQSVLYSLMADENAKLREALHANPPQSAVLARVLLRPPKTAYDTVLIDQGTASGVAKGDMAEFKNIALGRVVSAGNGTSLVQFFSSPGTDEDVMLGTPAAIAVAHGRGGGAFELTIPQGISVSPGDPVKTSGGQPLLLGTVASVSSKPDDASQTVLVRSPVNFSELDFIEVLAAPSPIP